MEAVHRDNDVSLNAVHSILDQMQIPAGPLLSRLGRLMERDKQIRNDLSTAMGSRLEAIERLTALNRQLSLPPEPGLCSRMVKDQRARVQVELEKIVAELAKMDPDYLKVDIIGALVRSSQELLEGADELMLHMRQFLSSGDPLARKMNDARSNLSVDLAKLRSKQFYGEQR